MATRDIAELGIVVDARQTQAATRALDDLDAQGKKTANSMKFLTDTAKLLAAAFAAFKFAKLIEETALLNARFETMGVVMRVAGNNAGYTGAQMAALEQDLTKTGISMIKARENLTSLATANIDLTKATKLARAAQDLAVVGNVNSSEAFSRLTQGIKSGEVEVLRTLGLNVNFENSYKKLATQLGTTAEKLTEQQKIQARTNATLDAASRYAGIYEEAMGTAGKQINSLSRYVEDAKVKVGELFNEALTFTVAETTKALKAANEQLDKMGASGGTGDAGHTLALGFQEAFKAVSVFGANVLFVLQTMGREVGGFGAILGQIFIAPLRALNGLGAALDKALTGDFKGAAATAGAAFGELGKGIDNVKAIWEDLDAQGEASRAALDAYEASVMGATIRTKEQTGAEKELADAQEQKRIAAGNAAREKDAADAKALAAQDLALKAAKKLAEEAKDFYKKTKEDSADRMTELLNELAGGEQLTASEKKRVEVLADLVKFKGNLTAKQKEETKATQDALVYLDKLNTARQLDKKISKEVADEAQRDVDAARAQTKSLQDQITYYGLTEAAVLKLKAAELERQIQNVDDDATETDRLERLLAETNKQYEAQVKLTKMKAETTFWTDLENVAHQTFLSIQNGSKGLWERMKDSAKNIFFEWLYQQTLKKWIINIGLGSSGAGGVSGIANAATGGSSASGFGSVTSLADLGSKIYTGITNGFAGVGASLGGLVTGLGNVLGSSSVSAFGAGMGLTGSQAAEAAAAYNSAGMAGTGSALTSGSTVGAGAGIFAGAAAGYLGGNAISGQYGSKSTVAAGTAIGAAIGTVVGPLGTALGALVGGLLGGVANRLFGMGEKKVQSTMIDGSLSATGTTGNNVSTWTQKGGWFRSDKKGTDVSAITAEQSDAFSKTYKSILDVSKVLGDTIGADTSALSARVQKLSIDFTGLTSDTDKMGAVTKFFEGVADSIALELLPNLKDFQLKDEALSVTMQRVVTDFASVTDGFASLSVTTSQAFGVTGAAAVAMSEQLIKAAGGVDKLAASTAYFAQNFLSAQEQLTPIQTELTKQLTALGYGSVKTSDDYKKAVLDLAQSGALATAEGAKTYAGLLALAPAFKAITDAADAAAKAAADAADAAAKAAADAADAAAKAAADAAKAANQAMEAEAKALGSAIEDSLSVVQKVVEAQKTALQKTLESTLGGIEGSIDAVNDKISNLKSLSDALKKPIVSVNSDAQKSASHDAARADIQAAIAAAKASGVLPTAESLQDALGVLGNNNPNQYNSMADYLREQAATGRDLEQLAGMTDTQLSVAQQTLQTLNAQKTAAQLAYDNEIARLDGILTAANQAAQAAMGTLANLTDLPAALAALATAIANFKAAGAAGNTVISDAVGKGDAQVQSQIEKLYGTLLGRHSDAAGLKYWEDSFKAGISLEEITRDFMNSAEYQQIHTGTAPKTVAENSSVVSELQSLNARMANVESNTGSTAGATGRTAVASEQQAHQFNTVTGGGTVLLTTPG